jgi:hypothetical protein
MDITIYLFCYNEQVLLPHALQHYKTRFPRARIVILLDTATTDESEAIARTAGCEVSPWTVKNGMDSGTDIKVMTRMKNNVWKEATTDWILIADMDEWLEITEEQLAKEDAAGNTMLHCRGVQIVAESQSLTLDDLDLHGLRTGYYDIGFNKHICFKRSEITEINFTDGAHKSAEKGRVQYGKQVYILKHMNFLGLPWFTEKMKERFARTHFNRHKFRCSGHYSNVPSVIETKWEGAKKQVKVWSF